jgi:hypothetical protein
MVRRKKRSRKKKKKKKKKTGRESTWTGPSLKRSAKQERVSGKPDSGAITPTKTTPKTNTIYTFAE